MSFSAVVFSSMVKPVALCVRILHEAKSSEDAVTIGATVYAGSNATVTSLPVFGMTATPAWLSFTTSVPLAISEPETVRLPPISTFPRNCAKPSMVTSPRTKSASRIVSSAISSELPLAAIIVCGSNSSPLSISLPSMLTSPRRVAPLASTAAAWSVPPATMSPSASRLSVRIAPATSRSSSIRAEPETTRESVTMPAAALSAPEKVTAPSTLSSCSMSTEALAFSSSSTVIPSAKVSAAVHLPESSGSVLPVSFSREASTSAMLLVRSSLPNWLSTAVAMLSSTLSFSMAPEIRSCTSSSISMAATVSSTCSSMVSTVTEELRREISTFITPSFSALPSRATPTVGSPAFARMAYPALLAEVSESPGRTGPFSSLTNVAT